MTERFTAMLGRDKSSEQERHEMAVIDAAVRGAGTDQPEDAALTDFALRISAARALPNDGFYRELDERFGVSESGANPSPRKSRSSRTGLLTTGGALASVLVVLIAVGGVNLIGKDSETTADLAKPAIPAPQEDMAAGSAGATKSKQAVGVGDSASSVAAPAPATAQKAPADVAPGTPRKVARTGDLVLATPGGNVENVSDGIVGITDRFGGYVVDSNVTGGDAANANANFQLQLPAAKFQTALAELSKLAHVRSRTQNTEDVTAPFSRARGRLTIARAQRDRLVSQYAAAEPGSREAAALKARLAQAEARVDARRADLSRLQNRVNFVGFTVAVVSDETATVDDGRGTLHRAFDTAVDALTHIAAVLLIVIAVALPFALIGGIGWAAARRMRRRRRNAAIDASAA